MATFIEYQSHLHFTRIPRNARCSKRRVPNQINLNLGSRANEQQLFSENSRPTTFPSGHGKLNHARHRNSKNTCWTYSKTFVTHKCRTAKKKKVLCHTVRVLKMVRVIILLRVDLPTRCGYACGQDSPLFIRGGSQLLLSSTCFPCSRSVPSLLHLKVCKVTL